MNENHNLSSTYLLTNTIEARYASAGTPSNIVSMMKMTSKNYRSRMIRENERLVIYATSCEKEKYIVPVFHPVGIKN